MHMQCEPTWPYSKLSQKITLLPNEYRLVVNSCRLSTIIASHFVVSSLNEVLETNVVSTEEKEDLFTQEETSNEGID